MNDYFVSEDLLKELEEIPESSIVSKTIHKDGDLKAILFGFAPGEELSEHTAAQPAVVHFLQGEARVTLGNDQMKLGSGGWAYMPANMPHSIAAIDKVVMMLLLV
ncbi:MAG: cupin domain-containing protein [Anaerolineae bacterium]|nr:cupin domain-containing protein [Anaerolineae bacterium]